MKGDNKMNTAICLECGKEFEQERDIQLCDNCIGRFDKNIIDLIADIFK